MERIISSLFQLRSYFCGLDLSLISFHQNQRSTETCCKDKTAFERLSKPSYSNGQQWCNVEEGGVERNDLPDQNLSGAL